MNGPLEEKLEVLADLKIQMRGLTNDNEEIKQTQEEVNTTLLNMNHHIHYEFCKRIYNMNDMFYKI